MKLSDGCRAWSAAVLAAILSACEGGGTDPGVPSSMVAAVPTSQAAVAGTPVRDAPAVRIADQRGDPVPGVVVTFTVAGGGGAVASVAATTDASGTASAGTWTLGPAPGDNAVTAAHGSLPPVHFLATAQARVASTVTAVSATAQMGVAGAAAAEVPTVRVVDQTGRVMHGALVRFAVTAGGGRVSYDAIATDAQGVASAGAWTLGAAEQNTLTATVDGVAPVQFSALARPRVATTMTTVSATSQTAVAGTAVAQAPTVRVDDRRALRWRG